MLRIHYYRYDQDYTGWDLWIWEKAKAGRAYMFNYNEFFYGDVNKIARIAEIDVPTIPKPRNRNNCAPWRMARKRP